MIDYAFRLNGITDPKYQPKDFEAFEIVAEFENTYQPNITDTEIKFVGDAAVEINNYIDGGLNGTSRGIFEGIPFEILLTGNGVPYEAFRGYIDLLEVKRRCDEVTVKLQYEDGLNKFSEKCQALTYGYLQEQGYFPLSELKSVPYVVNYIPDGIQLVTIGISLFLIGKETYETVPKIPEYIADVVLAAIPSVGLGVTINVGNIIICVVKLVLLIVYIVLMILAIIELIDQLFSEIYSVKRWHKGCRMGTLLRKGCEHLGYSFSSTIFDNSSYENMVFLPVKTKKGKLGEFDNDDGVPNASGYGYTVYEMFQLAMKMFNAKILIKNGTVYLESKNNTSFWQQNSTYVLKDVEILEKTYNTDELNPNYILKYSYDIADMNTIDNFTGTNYERITSPISINEPKRLNFGGLKEISLDVCLATRKESTNTIEDILSGFASVVDAIIGFFGGNSNFLNGFQNRIGCMNVSQHFGWQPKLVLMQGNSLPDWERTYMSAKKLYELYHTSESFVENNYGGQYEKYKDIIIPFCFHDFLKTINNAYFVTADGNSGKFEKITWNFTQMYAKVDFRIQKPYTKNLQETFIEA